ncbi:hypothetical protein MP638_007511 [Amoeboaphelidium occidentale]|nr:hypothetical protein MP638_007511 [Amoeboaphelidium occidentale]
MMIRNCFRYFTAASARKEDFYDVLVVGGGMAGQVCAAALGSRAALRNHRIGIIDAGRRVTPFKPETCYSNRVVSLSAGSIDFLKQTDIWNYIDESRVNLYQRIRAWDDADGIVEFNSDDIGKEHLAGIVEIQNVIIYYERKIKSIEYAPEDVDAVKVVLDNEQHVFTNLIVGADGANSIVRKSFGIETTGWSYNQNGLVATLEIEEINNDTAFQKFLPFGILALLPLSSTQSSIVWSLPQDLSLKLRNLAPEQFVHLVNAALNLPSVEVEYLISRISDSDNKIALDIEEELKWRSEQSAKPKFQTPRVVSVNEKSRACFPLRFIKSAELYRNRMALIGDAAHVVHPLAGQGVNLGFKDIRILLQMLESSAATGGDLGSVLSLERFSREATLATLPMIAGIDGLFKVFQQLPGPLQPLRSLGMGFINNTPLLKVIILCLFF